MSNTLGLSAEYIFQLEVDTQRESAFVSLYRGDTEIIGMVCDVKTKEDLSDALEYLSGIAKAQNEVNRKAKALENSLKGFLEDLLDEEAVGHRVV